MKYYDENSTEFDEFNYENDINDFNNGSNNLENEYENENKNESKNKNDNENKNENDNDNDNENRNGDGNNDESLKDKNKYTNEMTTSNNTSSNINNDNNNLGLLATKKLLSFSKTKKNTIHKRTVTQRSITSRAKSASSVKNLKSTKSSNKKKNSSTSNENNNGDSTGSFEIKKLRNDIVEIQELMSKSTQPVAIYSYLISKNNTNIDSVINALNNITELCDYQNVFKLIYNFSQISYQCISYLSKIGLTNKTLKSKKLYSYYCWFNLFMEYLKSRQKINNVTELLSSTNILHIHKIYFQKWTKFSKARNACLLNLLQCFSLQKKFRKNILLTYSMNLILKIFLMEKDFTNQKNILKIIKCLILDGLYIFIMF
ncbi:hypothetical protein LY90DRAFT_498997 [Neocallimastix californiae]|uniref:Uncharacterized protein n=1 Tax=Neocallimastix californiae TaxID=1754190 RepID=A0A1Y2FPN6_9FUNG|nr:hypothetical protein LY90DRAFT_498997 [Neocallimastix californiae]|eukprot:ORY85889.1 hypothetical protein LY90DRAFT_498997 [Neocallimastix californiae]